MSDINISLTDLSPDQIELWLDNVEKAFKLLDSFSFLTGSTSLQASIKKAIEILDALKGYADQPWFAQVLALLNQLFHKGDHGNVIKALEALIAK